MILPPDPPKQPGEDIVIHGLTWPKLISVVGGIMGSILVAAGALIWVLVGGLYGGISEKISDLSTRFQGLENSFHDTVAAGVSVKQLNDAMPTFQKDLNATRLDVGRMSEKTDMVYRDVTSIKQKLDTLQETSQRIQVELAGIEPLVKSISLPVATPQVPPTTKGRAHKR